MTKKTTHSHTRVLYAVLAIALAALACGQAAPAAPTAPTATATQAVQRTLPSPVDGRQILIGTEYITISQPGRIGVLAEALAPLELTMAKPLPEDFKWGNMQAEPGAELDFSRLDTFVLQFQNFGVRDLLLGLKSNNDWASKSYPGPGLARLQGGVQAEYLGDYAAWVGAVVERYDGDGVDDMPGLRYPVRYYEIGVEFSTYEPEPVEEYLELLELAYDAAHRAYPEVQVAHVAFLTSKALTASTSSNYEVLFENLIDDTHSLADMRAILDHPELFDLVNFHAVGANEVEPVTRWLEYEMAQRGYRKAIIISDVVTAPLIGWGPATVCERPPQQMGAVLPPATEADRCRLADYFTDLVNGDEATLRWTQAFTAIDLAKTVVIAAEQDIVLINTAYTEDLPFMTLPALQAGAGTAAWAGLLQLEPREFRASYYALGQVIEHLGEYDEIERLPSERQGLYIYQVREGDEILWIVWYDPGELVLPGDPVPETTVEFDLGTGNWVLEPLTTEFNQGTPDVIVVTAEGEPLSLPFSPTPVFIYSYR